LQYKISQYQQVIELFEKVTFIIFRKLYITQYILYMTKGRGNNEVVRMSDNIHQRLDWVDATKGIVIIGVLVAHIGLFYDIFPGLRIIFNVFVLTTFFFISGYLFNWDKYKNRWLIFIKKRFAKLMIPVYIFAGIALIFQYLYYIYTNEVLGLRFWTHDPITIFIHIFRVDLAYYSWFHSVWFLSALFICEMIFFILLHLVKSDKYRGLAVVLIAMPAFMFYYNQYTPLFFAPALAGMVYYYLGFMTKKYNLVSRLTIPGVVSLFIVFLLACSTPHAITNFAQLKYDNIIQWYIGGIAGALFICGSMFYIYKYKIKSKTLEYLGKNSLLIMLINIPVIFGISKIINLSSFGIYPRGLLFAVTMTTILCFSCLVNKIFISLSSVKKINGENTVKGGE